MSSENIKVVEKHYIEVNPSAKHKFFLGMLQGLGWGVGVTLGTAAVIVLAGFIISQINWVPVVGNYLQSVIESAQQSAVKK